DFGGREYESRVYRPGYAGSDQISEAERLAARYAPGSRAQCYVDSSSPEKACLARPSLWAGAFILLPLVFILVGGSGLVLVWKRSRPAETARPKAISESAVSTPKALGCLVGFFAIFFFAGLGTSLFFIRPALKNIAARNWPEVPCVVISSDVRSHRGNKSTTYNVDILYEYQVGDRKYRSNQYHFMGGSSGGYDAKAAVVAQNPPGTRRVCYVNPADPTDAVLQRSFDREYIVAIVPAVFTLVGLGGILLVLRGVRKQRAALAGAVAAGASTPSGGRFIEAEERDDLAESGPVVLKPPSALGKLFGMIFLAAFWNGIVSVFFWQMLKGWKTGAAPVGLTIFLIPFVLIGLAFIIGIGYFFLALFNPRPRLTLSRRRILLGGSATLDWSFSGSASRISRVLVQVEGREECRYRRGTTTCTDKNVFATIPVFDAPGEAGARAGNASFTIPAAAMHSFSAPDNKIIWTLKFTGEIPKWPDVSEDFELDVRPLRPGSAS
ncbi:MAG TPA: DUF3592 domain-containing protein, partial [Thermoanaerobaculia bacterium]|nr:DUF3592 domain-containing protein [Thermoanaerobaculia bacterium]